MRSHFLRGFAVVALLPVAASLGGGAESTREIVDHLGVFLVMAAALALLVSVLPRRDRTPELLDLEEAEYVGNIPPEWKIRIPADLSVVQRRARGKAQAPRSTQRALPMDAAVSAGEQVGQRSAGRRLAGVLIESG